MLRVHLEALLREQFNGTLRDGFQQQHLSRHVNVQSARNHVSAFGHDDATLILFLG